MLAGEERGDGRDGGKNGGAKGYAQDPLLGALSSMLLDVILGVFERDLGGFHKGGDLRLTATNGAARAKSAGVPDKGSMMMGVAPGKQEHSAQRG